MVSGLCLYIYGGAVQLTRYLHGLEQSLLFPSQKHGEVVPRRRNSLQQPSAYGAMQCNVVIRSVNTTGVQRKAPHYQTTSSSQGKLLISFVN